MKIVVETASNYEPIHKVVNINLLNSFAHTAYKNVSWSHTARVRHAALVRRAAPVPRLCITFQTAKIQKRAWLIDSDICINSL